MATPRTAVDDSGGNAVVVRVHYWIDNRRDSDASPISEFGRTAKRRSERTGIIANPFSRREFGNCIEVTEQGGEESTSD